MAVPIHSSTPTSFFNTTASISPPSLSCSTKVFVGLKPQNSSPFASAIPNLTAGFFDRVSKSLHSRYGSKPTRGRPRVHYRALGSQSINNALFRERIFFIGQYIDEQYSNTILSTMLYLDAVDDSRRLCVFISCPGGDLTPSLTLYDTMKSLNSPIGTHCMSSADNMAGFLLASGDKGHRSAMPRSRIWLQCPVAAAHGQADDIRNEANEILRIKDYLYKELAKNTGQTVEKINEDLARFKGFSAKEAVEYGLIDRIVRPRRIMPDAPQKDSMAGLG